MKDGKKVQEKKAREKETPEMLKLQSRFACFGNWDLPMILRTNLRTS